MTSEWDGESFGVDVKLHLEQSLMPASTLPDIGGREPGD
jgi:hypothetical protein